MIGFFTLLKREVIRFLKDALDTIIPPHCRSGFILAHFRTCPWIAFGRGSGRFLHPVHGAWTDSDVDYSKLIFKSGV